MTTLSEITERMIGGLHLTKIDKDGFHFTQGMSEMEGLIKKEAIKYFYLRFDYPSRVEIDKIYDVQYRTEKL